MASKPTQRSLVYFRKAGWIVAIVEKWNQYARVRQDIFNFGDLLVMHPEYGIALVQTTSGSNMAARRAKIAANPLAPIWKAAGGKIFLHAWGKRCESGRGSRKTWQVREEIL